MKSINKITGIIAIAYCFLSITSTFSQHSKEIIYVGENYKEIAFIQYQKKLKSELFDIAIVENDTAIFKKLRYVEFYGKLESTTKNQLFKLLNKRFNIDTSIVWLIHYIDSIPNIDNMPKESGIEFIDSSNKPTGIFLTDKEYKSNYKKYPYRKHKHIFSTNDYLKNISSEKKKVKKNVEFIHFYNYNAGFPEKKLTDLSYFKDPNSLISNLFNDRMKLFKVILIHPNGEFYVSKYKQGHFTKGNKLAKKSFYNRQKKKWLKRINKAQ